MWDLNKVVLELTRTELEYMKNGRLMIRLIVSVILKLLIHEIVLQ
jgi:hypothetical protein